MGPDGPDKWMEQHKMGHPQLQLTEQGLSKKITLEEMIQQLDRVTAE